MASTNPIDRIFEQIGKGDPATTPVGGMESFFDSIGLMRGSYAPAGRAVFGIAAGSLIMFALRPSFAFNPDGSVKAGARVPWWALPVALGAVFGVFV